MKPYCHLDSDIPKVAAIYINEQEEKREFKSCQVHIQQKTLKINFEEKEHQNNNKTIVGKSVLKIYSGEYATKLLSDSGNAVTGALLGPVNAVANVFAPERDYQQYVIQYRKAGGDKTGTILNINRSDAPEFQQELSLITGRLIIFREGQTDTVINVGPDLEDIKPRN